MKNFDTGYWSLSEIISILEGGNKRIVKYYMDTSGIQCTVGWSYTITFTNLKGTEFDFEARYKYKFITGYLKDF